MQRQLVLLTILLLAACGKEPTTTETPYAAIFPRDTVASLLANRERLKGLREQCRINRSELSDELCNIVGEANTKAFLGDGEVPYTPLDEKSAF